MRLNVFIDFYRGFLSDDPKHKKNNSSIPFAEQIKKLTEGLEIISNELQSQVREQHGALLSQASHAGKLSAALECVCLHMERLQAGADRLKNQVNIPYDLVKNQTHVLQRLHDASHLLRKAGSFLQLHRKLQSTKDSRIQACLLNELEALTEDAQLNRIDFIRDEKASVIATRQRINNLASNDLINGLKTENELQVVNSLQVSLFSHYHHYYNYHHCISFRFFVIFKRLQNV